jgi:hypothetical protein
MDPGRFAQNIMDYKAKGIRNVERPRGSRGNSL